MISLDEALETIIGNVQTLEAEAELIELSDAFGRVLAEDVTASLDLPPFDNSAMDGYAIRASDCENCSSLAITDYITAGGAPALDATSGNAARIMTGAPVPSGYDTIVPLEDAEECDGRISLRQAAREGQHVRHAGEDVKRGESVLSAGTLIRVPEISMLASLGKKSIWVYRKPEVAILATGDELAEPGLPLPHGKVFDSNSVALAAAVRAIGATPFNLGVAQDTHDDLRRKIERGLQADALITAAGVSVGDRDYVRQVLTEVGVRQLFWGVNIKPGKAMAFGLRNREPVFSLPGNPVSALVTFEELVRPALLKMMGRQQVYKHPVTAILQEDLEKTLNKVFFARVTVKHIDSKYLAWSAGNQETGILRTMLQANALAVLPAGRRLFRAGEEVEVHLFANEFDILSFSCHSLSASEG